MASSVGLWTGSIIQDILNAVAKLGCHEPHAADEQQPYYPRVFLVATPLGPRLPKMQAYHTSVMLDNLEHSFGPYGFMLAHGPQSHRMYPRNRETRIIDMGYSKVDARNWSQTVRPYFEQNSYDLLRKNCNSFSDVALKDLTGQRLDKRYREIEQYARTADKYSHVVRALTGGSYKPNPTADGFAPLKVVADLDSQRRLFR
mmetsp:Transcript_4394/g.10646  ORF Transcript_4394/g.10646 Transcript_4394/m.10646 type:complete len:201 (-) Transcript_4394:356-958(-)